MNASSSRLQGSAFTRTVQQPKMQAISAKTSFHYAPQPNCRFNADANIGHAFGIFMAYVGTLQPSASGAG
jgi:hypothetical protein